MIKIRFTKKFIFALCYFILLILVLSFLFSSFHNRFSWTPVGYNTQTFITDYEYEILDYIHTNNELSDSRIVSDPVTMRIFTSLDNREWLIEHNMNPIGFTQTGRDILTLIRDDVLLESNSEISYSNLMYLTNITSNSEKGYLSIKDDAPNAELLVIFSGRTAYWLDKSDDIFTASVLFPFSYTVKTSHIFQFLDSTYFELVHKIDEKIYLFKVRSEPNYAAAIPYFNSTYLNLKLMKIGNGVYDFDFLPSDDNQTFNLSVKNGNYEKWSLVTEFSKMEDFSGFDLLVVYFNGRGTNSTFRLSIDGPTNSDRTIFLFKDEIMRNRSVVFDLKNPTFIEKNPNLHSVIRVLLTPHLANDTSIGDWRFSITFLKLDFSC